MNERHEYLLGMLCEIHDICMRHDIDYYIVCGTLIGAVRHGGFLPWDDDADIAMTYDNFLKFSKACETDIPANRALCAPTLDENYRRVLPRYISRDTTGFHTTSSLQHDDVGGEVIDIFLLEPIGDSDEAWEKYRYDLMLYSSVVSYANANGTREEVSNEDYSKYLEIAKKQGRAEANRLLEERMQTNHVEDGKYYAFRWKSWPGRLDRSWFDSARVVPFEHVELLAPFNYEAFLRAFYGDEWYMVPPHIVQSKHRTAFSLRFPYTEALEYFKPTYDANELMSKLEERIALRLSNGPEMNDVNNRRLMFKAQAIAFETQMHVANNRTEFEKAMGAKDGATLASLLEDYLTEQTSKQFIGRPYDSGMYRYFNPILIPVGQEILDAALLALMQTHRVSHAARLLEIARYQHLTVTKLMEETEAAVASFRESQECFMDSKHEDGIAAAKRLLSWNPNVAEFHMLHCGHLSEKYRKTHTLEDRASCRAALAVAEDKFPFDGFFKKIKGDFLWEDGRKDEALELYVDAAETTDNGFALRSIAQTCGYHPARLRTPGWAKRARVPQWPADKPQPKSLPTKLKECDAPATPSREYMFALLCEMSSILDSKNITYTVTPAFARCIVGGSALPKQAGAYTLLCDPKELPRILNVELPPNRNFSYMGNDPEASDLSIRYHANDTLFIDLKREPKRQTGLYITIAPLEPKRHSENVERLLAQWRKSGGKGFEPQGRKARLYAWIHGLKGVQRDIGGKLFKLAAGDSPSELVRIECRDGKHVFDKPPLSKLNRFDYRGHNFPLPEDTEWFIGENLDIRLFANDTSPLCTMTATCDYETFCERTGLDSTFFARAKRISKSNAPGERCYKQFNENFAQLQLAVQVKEFALDLLPRKQEILDLHASGDTDALRRIMKGYLSLIRRKGNVGNVIFDEAIGEIALNLAGK